MTNYIGLITNGRFVSSIERGGCSSARSREVLQKLAGKQFTKTSGPWRYFGLVPSFVGNKAHRASRVRWELTADDGVWTGLLLGRWRRCELSQE
jgi:hypothetical protein